MFGVLDLFAGLLFAYSTTWMPYWLASFTVFFLVFKGVTTVIKFPIWFGPISFVAGVVDLLAGISMYVGNTWTGAMMRIVAITSVVLILKGGMTVVFGLVSR